MPEYNGLTIGFHGCDEDVARKVILNHENLVASHNEYDWLGSGIYFWENDSTRAWEFAKEKYIRPCVIGAAINLGYCLDLSTRVGLNSIRIAWNDMVKPIYETGILKDNKPGKKGENGELMLRFLDCYVIEALHQYNKLRN